MGGGTTNKHTIVAAYLIKDILSSPPAPPARLLAPKMKVMKPWNAMKPMDTNTWKVTNAGLQKPQTKSVGFQSVCVEEAPGFCTAQCLPHMSTEGGLPEGGYMRQDV
eukprot:NODE_3365_length_425_cov_40.916107_g3315_i0.p1 GENE.NODE_3365_length_425_cov_40.916107_g3315_i0~~NODE_3365_length_425_cov_40.916107_g3315_i0.p1  ORF type:complete len:124 (-),score=25.89 NODE_3365_length_425_cov_40.916107_g3315_i0:52-372(-)